MTTPEDRKFFEFLAPIRWPDTPPEVIEIYRQLVETGELQLETVLENALVVASGGMYTRLAIHRSDHSDGGEAKKTVSCFRQNIHPTKKNNYKSNWMNSFSVKNVSTKTGLIRVCGYSKVADKFYFFAIPHIAYKHLTTVLEIILDNFSKTLGECKGVPTGKWSNYMVDSFTELATITHEEAIERHNKYVNSLTSKSKKSKKNGPKQTKEIRQGKTRTARRAVAVVPANGSNR